MTFKKIIKYLHTRYVQGGDSDTMTVKLTRQEMRLVETLLTVYFPGGDADQGSRKICELRKMFLSTATKIREVLDE